jgi:zinc D-Ala-D-Ala carboxypeptidase
VSNAYKDAIAEIHQELGIPENYAVDRKLSLQFECLELSHAGLDIFNREVSMHEKAVSAWEMMKSTALEDGIELQLVSAYRSVEYQKNLFFKKINAGISISDILQVNAAPGYSEHHTGLALDLTCPDSECLEESFEATAAFAWLERHAADHAFRMSYPRENEHGLLYEPWHWCLIIK